MNSKNEPGRSPEKEIVLAFDAVDVRKEARHKKRGDQQRQGSETLVYQRLRPVLRPLAGRPRDRCQTAEFLRNVTCGRAPNSHTKRQSHGDAQSRAQTQNKV